jgi:mono/diheme cytochrome c family protein
MAPPNRFARALASPAPVLDLPPEKRRTVTYGGEVKPIVDAKCLSCHGPGGKEPRLGGVEALAPYVVPGASRRSPLVWHVLGRNTARPWDGEATAAAPKPMAAPGRALTPDEIRTLVEWIDLGGRP